MTQTETLTVDAAEVVAAVLYGKKDMRIETKDLVPPAASELQVLVTQTGICGSDLHYYHHGRNGDFALQHPLSLGHESAGIVTAVGSDVDNFVVGDRVALEVGIPCSECTWCKKGRYNLCPDLRFRGSCKTVPHYDGTLARKVNHLAKWCHRVPDAVRDLSLAALAEPLAVSLQGIKRSALKVADEATVLVLGAGAVGLLTAFAAKKRGGAKKVVVADISSQRVAFAVDNDFADQGIVLGGSNVIDSENPLAPAIANADFLKEKACANVGFDVVFECTGVQICVQTSVFAAAAGGQVVIIGMGTPMQSLPIGSACTREVDIIGVFRYAENYPDALAIVAEDGELVGKLVTHTMKLEDTVYAFEVASTPVDKSGNLVLKVMITG
ncbi:chaperonin 10-like protein [Lipomyces kononenkoae]